MSRIIASILPGQLLAICRYVVRRSYSCEHRLRVFFDICPKAMLAQAAASGEAKGRIQPEVEMRTATHDFDAILQKQL